jgi:hypothetical protein
MKRYIIFITGIMFGSVSCKQTGKQGASSSPEGKWYIKTIISPSGKTETPPPGYYTLMHIAPEGQYSMQHYKGDSLLWQYKGRWELTAASVLRTVYIPGDSGTATTTDSAQVIELTSQVFRIKDMGNNGDTIVMNRYKD